MVRRDPLVPAPGRVRRVRQRDPPASRNAVVPSSSWLIRGRAYSSPTRHSRPGFWERRARSREIRCSAIAASQRVRGQSLVTVVHRDEASCCSLVAVAGRGRCRWCG
jgi:hypothetical protein